MSLANHRKQVKSSVPGPWHPCFGLFGVGIAKPVKAIHILREASTGLPRAPIKSAKFTPELYDGW
jgi:hypothetical protein